MQIFNCIFGSQHTKNEMKKPQSAADKTNLGQVAVANKNGVTASNKKTNNLPFFFWFTPCFLQI